MGLFKWTEKLKPEFPKFIENLFGSRMRDKVGKGESVSSVPAVNVESTGGSYELEVAVPGMNRSDIKVHVENNVSLRHKPFCCSC